MATGIWKMQLPLATEPGTDSGVPIGIEDLVDTYGAVSCLMQHKHCLQQGGTRQHSMSRALVAYLFLVLRDSS